MKKLLILITTCSLIAFSCTQSEYKSAKTEKISQKQIKKFDISSINLGFYLFGLDFRIRMNENNTSLLERKLYYVDPYLSRVGTGTQIAPKIAPYKGRRYFYDSAILDEKETSKIVKELEALPFEKFDSYSSDSSSGVNLMKISVEYKNGEKINKEVYYSSLDSKNINENTKQVWSMAYDIHNIIFSHVSKLYKKESSNVDLKQIQKKKQSLYFLLEIIDILSENSSLSETSEKALLTFFQEQKSQEEIKKEKEERHKNALKVMELRRKGKIKKAKKLEFEFRKKKFPNGRMHIQYRRLEKTVNKTNETKLLN